jgi:hypothetical protein
LNARQIIGRLDVALARYGQMVTLQRTAIDAATGAITVAQEVTCPAKVRPHGPQDLEAGGVLDIQVILSPTGVGAFGIPNRDDRIVIEADPSNIEQIAPLYFGGELVRINLLCRG